MAIAPFVRQFAFADLEWFQQSDYPKLKTWLNEFIESECFNAIMEKYVPWDEGHERILFPPKNGR
jgi:glutathione S-transferase